MTHIDRAPMQNDGKLVRAVGFRGLILMCVNAVVGSGVFLLPSETFRLLGPFSLWAPLLFAIPVFILVLCFAEASSRFSEPGGAYLYTRTAFGEFVGFETGWMNTLARLTSLAALANGFVLSLARLYPEAGSGAPRVALIVGSLGLFAVIHSLGIRYGAGTIYFFTFGKVIPLVVFIAAALFVFRSNPIPGSLALPAGDVAWSEAALFLLFAYAGYENLPVPAGEFKNPKRDLPLALLAGIAIIAAIYSLTQFAAMSALPDLSGTRTPIADAAAAILGSRGAVFITIGAIISILGTNLGTVLEGSRMVYALALNGRRGRSIAWVHPRFRTPVVAIALLTGAAMVAAIAGTFAKLAVLSAVARLTTYLFTAASIPRLRKLSSGFVSPGGLLVPILGMAIGLAFFAKLSSRHLIAAAVALAVGAVLYFLSRTGEREAPS
ncbi:MAG TPA: APC family permease [Thermoanaerobaculia bacterium]|nr:APC family permease [Thermoanaerobaculia bacterium]